MEAQSKRRPSPPRGTHLNASTLNAHARATDMARNRRALLLFASGAALAVLLTLQEDPVESAEDLPLALFVGADMQSQTIEWRSPSTAKTDR
jgi:hypothetical protein